MKKLITVLLALLLAPLLSVTALADAAFFDYDTWVRRRLLCLCHDARRRTEFSQRTEPQIG
jgi:hypothetical protein